LTQALAYRFMFSFPFAPTPATVYVRALNALLRREPWAREQLVPHGGKVVCFRLAAFSVLLLIQPDGYAVAAGAGQAADVTLTLPSERMGDGLALLTKGNAAELANLMQVQGDAGLANVVSSLATHLRPDPEHELAALVGDAAAVRVMGAGRAVLSGARQAIGRVAGNLAEYVSEEAGLVAARPAFNDLSQRIAHLNARLDALDARLQRVGLPSVSRTMRGA
jgi:ubiquinone biosynthesis protein UbiJ